MSETTNWILDVGIENFEQTIERSRSVPVLFDFWAPWCEPCKELGPKLEKAAQEGGGRFLLAKVDIDQNAELAQMFRIQGIPAVLAVVDGKIADGFQGLQTDEDLAAFLDKIAPGGARSDVLLEAESLVTQDKEEEAVQLLEGFLGENPGDGKVRLYLAGLLADRGQHAEARKVFELLPEAERASPEARSILARIELGAAAGNRAELEARIAADPMDFEARIELAKTRIAAGQAGDGLEGLLELLQEEEAPDKVRRDAKASMLEAFQMLGMEDPVANEYRFKLSMVVFA